MGQHFLSAQPTMRKIVDALGASSDDVVLEIGCGMGLMTAMLAERVKYVYAVDADVNALEIAQNEFGGAEDPRRRLLNVEWINSDVLKVDVTSYAHDDKLLVIGNIPYNISSPILFHLLDHRESINRAVIMVQKEVAERVVAKPGGKDYGALSVMMQSYARCKKLFNVARTNFIPPPKVMSSVVEIGFSGPDYRRNVAFDSLRRVVQAAFQKRRKTLRNALLGSQLNLKPDELDHILADLGIDGRRRPETLSVEEFHRLAQAITS